MRQVSASFAQIAEAGVFSLALMTAACSNHLSSAYLDRRAIWEKTGHSAAYREFQERFNKFNNQLHLDEVGNCYDLNAGPVNLMIVVTYTQGNDAGVISEVLSDVDNSKSDCFKRSYLGISTPIPPFSPLVLHNIMAPGSNP